MITVNKRNQFAISSNADLVTCSINENADVRIFNLKRRISANLTRYCSDSETHEGLANLKQAPLSGFRPRITAWNTLA